MLVSQLLGARKKETPSECQTANHAFFIRGGYIRNMAAGSFSLYTPMRRVTQKIEAVIREEMDKIGGQEVLFPVVMPAALWQESGRYESIGSEMVRFADRGGAKNVLGMTHEEAAVHLARDVAASYQNYPFMIYQIQTKFRDEPRCRGGLVRVREFTMKDAYSFHTTWEDLREYYQACYDAYVRIFKRVGMAGVVAVQSDSGMMGGSVSHEFMFLSEMGEDTIVTCPNCGFIANMEAAETIVEPADCGEESSIDKIHTPNIKSIEGLCGKLKISAARVMKAVVYKRNDDGGIIIVFIRGDLEVNETKLRNLLGAGIHPAADLEPDCGLAAGFIGAVGLPEKFTRVFDRSLEGCANMYGGANEADYHVSGISVPRDLPDAKFADVAKAVSGGVCPECKAKGLTVSSGVEVGNIFQLGDKYTKAMKMQYLDGNSVLQYPIMGCYGIGVGRLAASVCEAHHDKFGPVWPISVAPWQVELCALNADETIKKTADALYAALLFAGVETLYDDRPVSAGVMFSDADLLGCPLRVIISPKTVSRDCVELFSRDKSIKMDLPLDVDNIVAEIKTQIELMFKAQDV